jgi:hypothetical protein
MLSKTTLNIHAGSTLNLTKFKEKYKNIKMEHQFSFIVKHTILSYHIDLALYMLACFL